MQDKTFHQLKKPVNIISLKVQRVNNKVFFLLKFPPKTQLNDA